MIQPTRRNSFRKRFNLSRSAIAHSWLTVSFWLAVAVAGFFAFSSLKYALFPDITFPIVIVRAKANLETVFETEAKITNEIERSLKSMPKLDEIRSSSYSSQAVVSLAFDVGTDLQSSKEAVAARLTETNLPIETNLEVIGLNLNESAAISYVIESGDRDVRELISIAQQTIIPPIAKLSGVLKVNFLGDYSAQNNSEFSENLSTLVNFNGKDALAFQVIKEGKANTLEVVDRVEQTVQKLRSQLPKIRIILAQTEADYLKEATQATIDSLLLAVVLAILVIFPFLRNWQATLITALAIPLSLLGTCIVIACFGFKLETITLLALALVIGIIVDDAIVDIENISRHIETGKNPKQAAILGTDEIGLTVTASTLTIVAVFLPVGLMGGTIGQFFKPFGVTVSAAVLISLLVARTLSPVLAVWWLKSDRKNERIKHKIGISQYYQRLLKWSLQHRQVAILIAIFSLVVGIALIPFVPKGFIPKLDRGEFNIVYTTPLPKLSTTFKTKNLDRQKTVSKNNFSWIKQLAQSPEKLLLNRTRRVGVEIETVVLNIPAVESVFSIAGVRGEFNKGKIYVKLKDNRTLKTADVQAQIRAALPKKAGVSISVEDIQFVDTGGEKPLKVGIIGDNLQKLTAIAQKIQSQIENRSGFVDITATGDNNPTNTSQIEHLNGHRVAYITANLTQGLALGDATNRVILEAKKNLPPGYSLDLEGDSAHSSSVLNSFAGTLMLSVICMLTLLILPFGRLLEPLVIALSLPLSIVGATVALLVTNSDFGMISLIGLIFLLGLLNKNAILLMDYTNQLRQTGMNRTEAILQTGIVRLRPIAMTTASTILGMLPIAIGLGAGAELRQPMAVAIIGGLVTSTLLSLIVVPVLYTLLEDYWLKIKSGQ